MYNQFFTIKPRISEKKRRKQTCTPNIYFWEFLFWLYWLPYSIGGRSYKRRFKILLVVSGRVLYTNIVCSLLLLCRILPHSKEENSQNTEVVTRVLIRNELVALFLVLHHIFECVANFDHWYFKLYTCFHIFVILHIVIKYCIFGPGTSWKISHTKYRIRITLI